MAINKPHKISIFLIQISLCVAMPLHPIHFVMAAMTVAAEDRFLINVLLLLLANVSEFSW